MPISVRSSRRLGAILLAVVVAGASACDSSTNPSNSLTTDQLQTVATGIEAVVEQPIFLDLFGGSVLANAGSATSAREVAAATREMIDAAARSVSASGEFAAVEAFPVDIKGKTFVPTASGGWVWDPAEPSPGSQAVRFVVRNSLGQTRGWLTITDQNLAGAASRYRAELITTSNVKVMDYVNQYSETYLGTELSAYSYAVNGYLTDGQTNIGFDYRINEAGLTTTSPTGTESYTVDIPRLETTLDLTGQGTANGWTNDYTMTVRQGEVRWVVGADNSVRMYRGTEHIATGTRSDVGGTSWRSPNNSLLSPSLQAFVTAADRAGEAMFAPVTATILVDWMLLSVQP